MLEASNVLMKCPHRANLPALYNTSMNWRGGTPRVSCNMTVVIINMMIYLCDILISVNE
jgi:hypothetical protein